MRRHCPDSADAVLVVGTGFRAATTIAPLEEDLGRPVITANQASLWHCLRIAGIGSPVSGWGRLFGLSVAAPDRG